MPRAEARRTQSDRSEATVAQLIEAAREMFASDGYQATTLDHVVARAKVTTGALYHHFRGKRELFEAVYEREERRLARISGHAYAQQPDRWEGVHAACRAFLEASLDPGVQRITLIDGPAILGWDRLRAIQDRHTVAQLRLGLQTAIDDEVIAPRPLEPLVQMLNGAICDAAMYAARANDEHAATRQVAAELRVMLDALSAPPVPSAHVS